jgi:hypothetical protein
MNHAEDTERTRIIRLALQARTEADVACAIHELDRWVAEHPDDENIRDAYEPLVLRQMAFGAADIPSIVSVG